MLIEAPELIDYLSRKLLEDNIEIIRSLAASGGDAIYIDDATATLVKIGQDLASLGVWLLIVGLPVGLGLLVLLLVYRLFRRIRPRPAKTPKTA